MNCFATASIVKALLYYISGAQGHNPPIHQIEPVPNSRYIGGYLHNYWEFFHFQLPIYVQVSNSLPAGKEADYSAYDTEIGTDRVGFVHSGLVRVELLSEENRNLLRLAHRNWGFHYPVRPWFPPCFSNPPRMSGAAVLINFVRGRFN